MDETIQRLIDAINECMAVIPGGANAVDAAATDYLIRRLCGEQVSDSVGVIFGDMPRPSERFFAHTSAENPQPEDLW